MRFHKYKLDVPENAPLNKTAGDKYWNKLLKEPKERILSLWTTQNESAKKKKTVGDKIQDADEEELNNIDNSIKTNLKNKKNEEKK